MRKLLTIWIGIWYLAFSAGAAVQWHYCMGQLRDVAIGHAEHSAFCNFCGMEADEEGCCQDVEDYARIDDAHQPAASQAVKWLQLLQPVPTTNHQWEVSSVSVPVQAHPGALPDHPPRGGSVAIHTLHCLFRC